MSTRLEMLEAIIVFAAGLRSISKARHSKPLLVQVLTDVIQAGRTVKQLLPTGSLRGRQRASLEKWVEQTEEELRALLVAHVSNDPTLPLSEPQLTSEKARPNQSPRQDLGIVGES